jgi:hypothetical protein
MQRLYSSANTAFTHSIVPKSFNSSVKHMMFAAVIVDTMQLEIYTALTIVVSAAVTAVVAVPVAAVAATQLFSLGTGTLMTCIQLLNRYVSSYTTDAVTTVMMCGHMI